VLRTLNSTTTSMAAVLTKTTIPSNKGILTLSFIFYLEKII
jgi:hypothetical protein